MLACVLFDGRMQCSRQNMNIAATLRGKKACTCNRSIRTVKFLLYSARLTLLLFFRRNYFSAAQKQTQKRFALGLSSSLFPASWLLIRSPQSWCPGSIWRALGAWWKSTWVGCRVWRYTHVIGAANQIPQPYGVCETSSLTQGSVCRWPQCSSGSLLASRCSFCRPCASCLSCASMTPPCKARGGTGAPCHAWSSESSFATACNIRDGNGPRACVAPRSACTACLTPSQELPLRGPCIAPRAGKPLPSAPSHCSTTFRLPRLHRGHAHRRDLALLPRQRLRGALAVHDSTRIRSGLTKFRLR